jgi:hypothetical protein
MDIGVAQARLVRQTSYYSGFERGIEDLKAGSCGVNMVPAGSFSGETGQCIYVAAKYTD